MYLAIDAQTGIAYVGVDGPNRALPPGSSLTQATLIKDETSWAHVPSSPQFEMSPWLFLEHSFDPVTRIRRGSLYQVDGREQPRDVSAPAHPDEPLHAGVLINRRIYGYIACTSLIVGSAHGAVGATLALGTKLAASTWRVVQAEVVVGGAVLVTLKAATNLGVLPDVDTSTLPDEFKAAVVQAVARAADAAYRESPTSVVDQCRNALTVVVSRWLALQGHDRKILNADLGQVATAVALKPYERTCVGRLADVVGKLHVRGKENERQRMNLRSNVDEDAELSIHALGFALRDLGMART